MNNKRMTLIPIMVFLGLAFLLFKGLYGDPKLIPSVLIGKPVPVFDLPAVSGIGVPGLKSDDLKQGQVTIVNIWASWCVPCRAENPVLMALSKRNDIRLVGINNKDDSENAKRFMATYGNPFVAIGADLSGRTTIEWGAYGVPETFVVDGKGIIRAKIIGGINPDMLNVYLPAEIAKAAKPLP
jgi:cytochrome c biogenesis protein CcmG, thiol:disulfide interchange protein DsbE